MFWWCKASTTDQVRVQSGRGALPISLCMASMPADVESKPWAGTFDSLTWAPAPCLACEMVPFFPNTNALHPCTLTVCVYQWHICVAMYFTIVARSGKQQYTSTTTSGIFKIVSMMTCRCGPLPRVWVRSCFQFFAGPVQKFAQCRLTS